ncbi:MAG: lactonase family protein [Methylobacterium frigidaeris]
MIEHPAGGRDARAVPRRAALALMAAGLLAAPPRTAHAASSTMPMEDLPMTPRSSPARPRSRAALAYVGCRTTRARNARGDGIAVYRVPDDGSAWERIQLLDGLTNPSFLAFDHGRRMLYTVHGDAGEVSAFRVDAADGRLSFVNQASCRGRNPVHLVVDPSGRHLLVANHVTRDGFVSGLAVLALGPDGALGEVVDHVPISGRVGPHRVEQPFAKPHQVQFDPAGRFVAVPDKGLDLILSYRLDGEGKLHPAAERPAATREGEGPRHIAFHPSSPYAYVVNELSSTVMACRYEPGSGALRPIQELPALPDDFLGFSRAAEIEVSPDGRFVYATNRGHDSVAAFAVEPGSGRLRSVGWTGTQGETPRFFAQDPAGLHLFVANEDSDTIVRFTRDPGTGALSAGVTVARTGSPTCIVFSDRGLPAAPIWRPVPGGPPCRVAMRPARCRARCAAP